MHEKMTKMMAKSEEICQIKETLISWLKEEVNTGKDCCHLQSAGDVADMIKDLAKAEKDCAEAMYYTIVGTAMLEAEDPSYGAMGYNPRHLNNGRFASAGRGHMVYGGHHSGGTAGFHPGPFTDQEPYINAYLHDPNKFKDTMMKDGMGYDNGMYDRRERDSKHGRAYDEYKEARRHYTASKDPSAKERMDYHAMMYVDNALEGLQEMWESSDDAALKKRIMDDATRVLNQMKSGSTMKP